MEALPQNRIDRLIDLAKFADVAVVSGGDPYVSPLSFVRHEDSLYFRCAAGERVEALRAHPRASVSIVEFDEGTGGWESVLVRGEVSFVGNDQVGEAIVALFLDKYHEYTSELGAEIRLDENDAGTRFVGAAEIPRDEAVLFRLEMREVTGRTSGRWMTPGTRPGRL